MTAGEVGERYTELGGQAPLRDERGKAGVERARRALEQADSTCAVCAHFGRYHANGHCNYPVAPRGEDCGPCTGCQTKEEPVSAPTKDTP